MTDQQGKPQEESAPNHDAKVSALVAAIVRKQRPDLAEILHVKYDGELHSTFSVRRNGSGVYLTISLLPNNKIFMRQLQAAIKQVDRTLHDAPLEMLPGERKAWTVLKTLGAKQVLLGSQWALDLRTIKATNGSTPTLIRASREICLPGGANRFILKDGVPIYATTTQDLGPADVARSQDSLLGGSNG